jgi:hypothetical protein
MGNDDMAVYIVEENQTVDVSDLKSGIYIVTGKDFNHKMVVVNSR